MAENYLFICQREDGDIFIDRKENILHEIDNIDPNRDLDFETIGRIPLSRFSIDSDISILDFHQPDTITKEIRDRTMLLAIQYALDYKIK